VKRSWSNATVSLDWSLSGIPRNHFSNDPTTGSGFSGSSAGSELNRRFDPARPSKVFAFSIIARTSSTIRWMSCSCVMAQPYNEIRPDARHTGLHRPEPTSDRPLSKHSCEAARSVKRVSTFPIGLGAIVKVSDSWRAIVSLGGSKLQQRSQSDPQGPLIQSCSGSPSNNQ
jgi:hypothetical protein